MQTCMGLDQSLNNKKEREIKKKIITTQMIIFEIFNF